MFKATAISISETAVVINGQPFTVSTNKVGLQHYATVRMNLKKLRAALEGDYSSFTESASEALRRLRSSVLDMLQADPDRPVVALHNNAGIDYSASEYQRGQRLAADASAVSIGRAHAPADFFVVTESSWFERLAAPGFNVVLQSPDARDDGSLSIWFQRKGRSYINVEARHGRLDVQRQMLRAVASTPSGSADQRSVLSTARKS